jgi:hypothetical protein
VAAPLAVDVGDVACREALASIRAKTLPEIRLSAVIRGSTKT